MRKEILRINNLTVSIGRMQSLENITLCILEGEMVGFLGLAYSGKDLTVKILSGEVQEELRRHHIYIGGRRISEPSELAGAVYRIAASNYVIDDWTVAEYVGLVESGWFQLMWKKRRLEEQVKKFFGELGVDIGVSGKMKDLSELEKRIVDVVKAKWNRKKILIVEDEFEGMGPEDIRSFGAAVKRLIAGDMGVVINSHSDMVLSLLSEKYVIFKKGRLVKKCRKDYIKNGLHLEKFLLGGGVISKKKGLDSYMLEEQEGEGKPVYRIEGLRMSSGKIHDFNFLRGEIVTFLALDGKVKEGLFMILSGRRAAPYISCVLNSRVYRAADFSDYVREKVVSVMHMGSEEEVFAGMSAGENLLIPSLRKISSLEYIANSSKIPRMLGEELGQSEVAPDAAADSLGVNDIINITLERWYIYNPKVLILFEPFARCDLMGVSIVKSYIKKFANRGSAVIIIKSREEYVEDISDQIISVE